MQIYEISALLKHAHYAHKDNWEQARLIAYLIAQTHSTKHLKLEDIIKFSWEADSLKVTSITNEEVEMLSRQAAELEKMFSGQIK